MSSYMNMKNHTLKKPLIKNVLGYYNCILLTTPNVLIFKYTYVKISFLLYFIVSTKNDNKQWFKIVITNSYRYLGIHTKQ